MSTYAIASVRRMRQWVPALLAALALVGCQTVGPEFTYSGTLTYDATAASITTQPLHELATLDQAVVSGTITVFVESDARMSHVSFYLDDPDRGRAPVLTSASAPYDLLLDTTTLADGEHTLTAVTRMPRGKSQTLETATFVASNSGDGLR